MNHVKDKEPSRPFVVLEIQSSEASDNILKSVTVGNQSLSD